MTPLTRRSGPSARVRLQLRDGMLLEAEAMLDAGLQPGSTPATTAIGYRQAMEYIQVRLGGLAFVTVEALVRGPRISQQQHQPTLTIDASLLSLYSPQRGESLKRTSRRSFLLGQLVRLGCSEGSCRLAPSLVRRPLSSVHLDVKTAHGGVGGRCDSSTRSQDCGSSRELLEARFMAFLVNFQAVTRKYTTRQLTWFRKEPGFHYVDVAPAMDDPRATATQIAAVFRRSAADEAAARAALDDGPRPLQVSSSE